MLNRIEGGAFMMGATSDQYDPDTYTDKPAHLVFLSPFYIATTEVTNCLWRAVMNEREMLDLSGYPDHPVSQRVSAPVRMVPQSRKLEQTP